MNTNNAVTSRRAFMGASGLVCGALAVGVSSAQDEQAKGEVEHEEEMVSPAEDLMREHGVLKRVLLVYDEGVRRLTQGQDVDPANLRDAASIIRTFIEDYHEKLEEDHLFPRFPESDAHAGLVATLKKQHQAGRLLTDRVLRATSQPKFKDDQERRALANDLKLFVRMYEPHEAWEDTVLFPAFQRIVTPHEYGALGEDFEKKEHELFGEDGFERTVDRVATIEKALGIYDLAQFTPAL